MRKKRKVKRRRRKRPGRFAQGQQKTVLGDPVYYYPV